MGPQERASAQTRRSAGEAGYGLFLGQFRRDGGISAKSFGVCLGKLDNGQPPWHGNGYKSGYGLR